MQCVQEITYAQARAGFEPFPVGMIVLHFLPGWLPWAAFTPMVLALAKRYPMRRGAWGRSLAVHAAGAIAFGLAHLLILSVVRTRFLPLQWGATDPVRWLLSTLWSLQAQAEVLAYAGVVAAGHGFEAISRARAQELRSVRLQTELTEARLGALQSQLQPHFLFNTLNAIDVLIDEEPAQAKGILLRLAGLLRSSLDDRRLERPLSAELKHLRIYLDIEQMRLGERLEIVWNIGPGLDDALVPSLLLQPLVENALIHGIAPRSGPGKIWIEVRREGDALALAVDDDGIGIDGSAQEGIGLGNTRRRLTELHGGQQELRVSAREGGGVTALVRIPWAREER